MDKKKEYTVPEENNEQNKVEEPAAKYQVKTQRTIPDYVLEDIRVSLEQFERGECEDAITFLKTLYH